MDTNERFLSLGQFARAVHANKTTVGRALERGLIKGQKRPDGVWAIPASEIDGYKKQAMLPGRGRRLAPSVLPMQPTTDTAMWERLVESERKRADAAEQRCNELMDVLKTVMDRG